MKDSDKVASKIPASTRAISAHPEMDLTAQYTGVKNLTVSFGIKNLLDEMRAYSAMGSTNAYGILGFAHLYNAYGRYFYLGLVANFSNSLIAENSHLETFAR